MFQFTSVPASVQEKHKYRNSNYIRVLYKDPNPILINHHPEPCVLPETYKKCAQIIKDFPVRNEDIWILSHPKTGTTLAAELITVLLSGLDFAKLEETPLRKRTTFLDKYAFPHSDVAALLSAAASTPSPRVIKTHLPVNLLPHELLTKRDQKMIYTVRNPKDSAVSYYHHMKYTQGYSGSLNDLLDGYLSGDMMWGSYFRHLEEYLQLSKMKENLLVIRYEDMIKDMPKVIKEVAEFLGISLNHAEIETVANYVHFDQMKDRKSSNFNHFDKEGTDAEPSFKFLRMGKVGSFKKEMPEEYIELFDKESKKWEGVMELYPELDI